jgi:hypothetical protein
MVSSVNTAVPIIVIVTLLVTLFGIIYGTLELYDSEISASDVLKDLLSGDITLRDILEGKKKRYGVCTGPDKNAAYEYDDDGKCAFLGCKPGYVEQDGVCIQKSGPSVDCVIDGYTYGECILKLNETCGEGVGQQLKIPNIITGAIGNGSCESATYVDCDIKCPDICRVPDNAYSTPEGVGCVASTPSGESVVLGEDTGYCGQGTLQRKIVPNQIPQSVLEEAGYTNIDDYLAYANPNGVCPEQIMTTCPVECKDGLLDVGCDYKNRWYEFVKDSNGTAICFNKEQTEAFIAGTRTERPEKLKTILAADVITDDGTYDVEGKIPEYEREGLTIQYLSDQGMSYDNLVKNDCTLIKTQSCSAPREKKNCVIGALDVSDCISPGCGQQMYQTVTQGVTIHPFGDGEACPDNYSTVINRTNPSICGTSLKCCGESDYKRGYAECKDDGKATYTLDSTNCDANGLPETKEVDCYYQGDWEATGECELKDGTWKEKFTRFVKNSFLAQSGTDIGTVKHEATVTCAPVDCQGNWSDWTECTKSCGGGTKTRTWTTLPGGQPKFGGQACPSPIEESEQCNTLRCCDSIADYKKGYAECKDDGNVTYTLDTSSCVQNGLPETKEVSCCYRSSWEDEDGCHQDGDVWKGKQTRTVVNSNLCGNDKSTSQYIEDSACDPVNCVMNNWKNSGVCGADGIQEQTRTVKTAAKYGGAACGSTTQEISCCYRSSWENEDGCHKDGDVWKGKQTRTVVNSNLCGNDKSTSQYIEDSACDPVDCVMNSWKNSGPCSADGIQKQTRTVKTAAKYGGAACGSTTQDVTCPVNCSGGWGDWGACDCETGKRTKSWVVTKDEINNGSCVNRGKTLSEDCNRTDALCPTVCKVKDKRLPEIYCKYEYDYDTCVNKRAGRANEKICNWIPEPTERGGGWLLG